MLIRINKFQLLSIVTSVGLYIGGDGESPERTQANYVP
jgi:hypothetical protein